jgi:hypothetical protein
MVGELHNGLATSCVSSKLALGESSFNPVRKDITYGYRKKKEDRD